MSGRNRNWPRENGRDSASSLSAAESPDAARNVAVAILRRQAHLLACIHHVVMEDLIRRGLEASAEEWNDGVKPVIDIMFSFDFHGDPK